MAVIGYEFRYDTPTAALDNNGNPISVNVPMTFTLGVPEDVARGIRRGLRNVASITNVSVSRVSQVNDALTADTS